jgi:hypothetical protein
MAMADDRLPWFPCEHGKLLGALSAMKPHVGYTYWIVCLRCYEVNGPCPDSLDALARRTGYSKRVVSDALDVLFRAGKLIRDAAGIINPYAAKVMDEMRARRGRLSRSGKEGAIRRWEKVEQNQRKANGEANGHPIPRPMAFDAHARVDVLSSLSDSESLFKEESFKEARISEERSSGWNFDAFWNPYPNKVGKTDARKSFERIRKSGRVTFEDLMMAWRRYIAKTDDRPWCNPATWLNQGRWEDQPAQNGGANGIDRNGSSAGGRERQGGGFASLALKRAREASGA